MIGCKEKVMSSVTVEVLKIQREKVISVHYRKVVLGCREKVMSFVTVEVLKIQREIAVHYKLVMMSWNLKCAVVWS